MQSAEPSASVSVSGAPHPQTPAAIIQWGTYDRQRLKLINVPVLKAHRYKYGATACVKNNMGVVTTALSTNSHNACANGLMGAVLGEIRPADLNILDCIFVSDGPVDGPGTLYSTATRRDELVAGIDPVAVDIWSFRVDGLDIVVYDALGTLAVDCGPGCPGCPVRCR